MRWDALFADLEAQLASAASTPDADLLRAEVARTPLLDRLRAQVGGPVGVWLRDGSRVAGVLQDAGTGWLLVREDAASALLPASSVARLDALPRAVAAPAGQVERRLGLGPLLRALSRDRAPVRLHVDGAVLTGTIDRVGADHLDLAEHALGEPRRPAAVRGVVTVPFAAVLVVRSAG